MATAQEKDAAKSHVRRDLLLQIQKEVQTSWENEKAFEADAGNLKEEDAAPLPGKGPTKERFFGNFPYPYMNGLLHLGHAFTLSRVEFACAYHRLRGSNVLFPFGFHCTGMPIKACADKLSREIALYGCPPQFPKADEDETPLAAEVASLAVKEGEAGQPGSQQETDPAKFKGKKSKAAAKAGTAKFQWDIMRSMGLTDEQIKPFSNAQYWLTYFPPLAVEDLKAFGLGVDWRRSFITTDMNPYYDSFASWHMQTLYNKGKVVKDRRYTIFSPLDGQPCADHDRASGEGVLPQEYTLIKMAVLPPLTGKLSALEGKAVYLAAATLRPETMYGQTNAWVLPDGEYGAFEVAENEVFVVTKRAATNMAYQFLSKDFGKNKCLLELTGQDLIGAPLKAPLTSNAVIYALPMLTILTDKGTGVVTSVPSDSPDDYMALHDLKAKPALRQKFGVKDEWVLPFEVIPIINIPEFGDASAEKVCQDLKIKSQNDKEKLAEAKRLTYLKGFTDGVMLVGEFKGQKVQDVKPLIKKMLIDSKEAVLYSEPEKKVVSRSGDECVVALTDQWYLTYGEDEWKAKTEDCLKGMELYSEETRHGFEHTLGWLDRWACSRSFGLGTRIPWDPQFLIESLSDSTIYMAYYTVAHILQEGDMFGTSGRQQVKREDLTPQVWDYFFQGGPLPTDTRIPAPLLEKARKEFDYWYPFDLRASGKDLINNHLTFCLYNHTAMFPKSEWPRSYRCNGHLLLNSEKMSKSTGNFKTVRQAVEEFSADATRFALADAGDTVDDANFVEETANAAILRLTKEITWMEEVLEGVGRGEGVIRAGTDSTFADRVFENEMNLAITLTEAAYERMLFREALKTGFFDLQLARDEYRLSCGLQGMRRDLLLRFLEVQTQLLTPICPHYAEHVWRKVLKKPGQGIRAGWPVAGPTDMKLKAANKYLQDSIVDFRKLMTKQEKGGAKQKGGRGAQQPPEAADTKLTVGRVFVADKYGGWQEECLTLLQAHYNAETKSFSDDAAIMAALKSGPLSQRPDFKKLMGQAMGFMKFKKDAALQLGAKALDVRLEFDEAGVLRENEDLIKRQLGLEEFTVHSATDAASATLAGKDAARLNTAVPGAPIAVFLASGSS